MATQEEVVVGFEQLSGHEVHVGSAFEGGGDVRTHSVQPLEQSVDLLGRESLAQLRQA